MAVQGHAVEKREGLNVQIVFRTDASFDIGTGHVMRCLTLAEALRQGGANCRFVCRTHSGNLIEVLRERAFFVHELPYDPCWQTNNVATAYAAWLGSGWQTDAEQTKISVGETAVDWLVVDHYAIEARWERALAPRYHKLMVIDDLANRVHACDFLLDQTFGRAAADYRPLVPANCMLLCGSQYALLRPEFAALRPYSIQRRDRRFCREMLITMGGVDKDNATRQVLQALCDCPLHADCRITVVMGSNAPWLNEVRTQAQDMPWPTQVLVGISNMAKLMADSDLVIGTAGATSWERCCLGVPAIILVLAENQRKVAQELEQAGAARIINLGQSVTKGLREHLFQLINDSEQLLQMSERAASILDGVGVDAVISKMSV